MDAWNYEQWFALVQRWGTLMWTGALPRKARRACTTAWVWILFHMIQSVWACLGLPLGRFGGVDYANINSRFVWDGNVSNNEYKNALAVALQVPYVPKEYVSKIIYSVEEQEDWANTRAAINNLVLERMAQFATGQMDIHDDAQWAQFQQELKDLGSEELLAMDQAAFNRTMGVE